MADADKTVFISYRRSVSKFIARSIFMDLHYHGYDVFLDVENINNGTFENIILNQIAARAHFLVILTPGTLERCVERGDWLRREIEFAMDLKRNIVPITIDDFALNTSLDYLTGKLAQLPDYNALKLPYEYFDAAMDKLRNHFLKQPVYSALTPTPSGDKKAVDKFIQEAVSEPKPTLNELHAESYLIRGLHKWATGDLVEAIADFDEAIRLNPTHGEAYSKRAIAREGQGDVNGALADFNRAVELASHESLALVHVHRGSLRLDLGDVGGAISDYDHAIHLNPDYTSAYYIRGNVRFNMGNLDGAILDYDRVVALNPQFADAYYNRGLVRSDRGDWEGAIADFTKAIGLSPRRPDAYYHRALARRDGSDLDGAIADISEAIGLSPQDSEAYFQRAAMRYRRGDFEGSIRDCSRMLEFNTRSIRAYALRGNAYMACGKAKKAIADYTEVITLSPAYYSAYNNRGEALFEVGQFRNALTDFKQAVELSKGEPIAVGGLAITFHALGNTEKASYLWGKLITRSRRYRDGEWIQQEFNWTAPLVEEARKLIAKL